MLLVLASGLGTQAPLCASMAAGQPCEGVICPLSGPVSAAENAGLAWMCHPGAYQKARLSPRLNPTPPSGLSADGAPEANLGPALAKPMPLKGQALASTPWAHHGPALGGAAPPTPPPRLLV